MLSMRLKKKKYLSVVVCASVLSMTACGGGGGGGGSGGNSIAPAPVSTPQMAVSEIATESPPVGPVVDIVGLNLLPLGAGDQWEFDIIDENGQPVGSGQRAVGTLPPDASSTGMLVSETESGETTTTIAVKQNNGLFVDYTLDTSLPPQAARLIGLVREYAVPAYAIGETRTVVRQGTWDADADGDGQPEQFRLEYTQVFRGFESLTLPSGTISAAHFSNAYRFTVTASATGEVRGVVSSEEAYLAQNLGPVKLVRHAEDLEGKPIEGKGIRTWVLKAATVGGATVVSPAP